MPQPIILADPRYKAFIEEFACDPLAFAEQVCGLHPSEDQAELFRAIEPDTARVSVVSGTTTGKTNAFARIAVWHLLCLPIAVYEGKVEIGSNCYIGGPALRTVLDGVFKELSDVRQAISQGRYAWLNGYWTLGATTATVNGFEASWFIKTVAFPKGQSAAVAGRHRYHQLIIIDEACGVADGVFDVVNGTQTQPCNRTLLASQGAKNTGFFHSTHHALSIENGGAWTNLSFSSERSPFATQAWLMERLFECDNDRNNPEYMIRVRGKFAESTSGNLLVRADMEAAFQPRKIIQDSEPFGLMILGDVAAGEYRDSSVATVAKVIGDGDFGEDARRVEYQSIPINTNSKKITDFTGDLKNLYGDLSNATLYVDAGGIGAAVCQALEREGIPVIRVNWGMPCFKKEYKNRYFNLRACALVRFRDAVRQGRVVLPQGLDKKMREKIMLQGSRIPYHFTETGGLRYQIMSKEDMRKESIPSPDIIDTFSFAFLEGASYIPSGGTSTGDLARSSLLTEMNRELEDALKGIDGLGDLAELADLPE